MGRPLSLCPGLSWVTPAFELSHAQWVVPEILFSPEPGHSRMRSPKGRWSGPSPPHRSEDRDSALPLLLYSSGVFPGPYVISCGIEVGPLWESPRPEHLCGFQSLSGARARASVIGLQVGTVAVRPCCSVPSFPVCERAPLHHRLSPGWPLCSQARGC